MSYLSVIMWICIIVFAASALIALLDLSGLRKIEDKGKSKVLFTTLIIAVVGAGAAAFKENLNDGSSSAQANASSLASNSPNNNPVSTESSGSIKITNDDLLAMKGGDGVAVVSVQATNNCKAVYYWRFLPDNSSKEEKGSGELYEKYAIEKEDGNNHQLIDLNGKLSFKAGPYTVSWSCSDAESSHMYVNGGLKFGKLKNAKLETFKF